MKVFLVASLTGLFTASCSEKQPPAAGPGAKVESHEEAVARFVEIPQRVRQAVESVRTAADFDRVNPDLKAVVVDFQAAGEAFRKLQPPAAADQERYRQAIQTAFSGNEPTGEAMLRLMAMPDREDEAAAWLESFALAGQETGKEVLRLYGAATVTGTDEEKLQVDRVREGIDDQIRTQLRESLSDMKSKPVLLPDPGQDGMADNPMLKYFEDPREGGE